MNGKVTATMIIGLIILSAMFLWVSEGGSIFVQTASHQEESIAGGEIIEIADSGFLESGLLSLLSIFAAGFILIFRRLFRRKNASEIERILHQFY